MNLSDVGIVALAVASSVVPLTAVLVVALLRGYTISVHVKRPPRRDR